MLVSGWKKNGCSNILWKPKKGEVSQLFFVTQALRQVVFAVIVTLAQLVIIAIFMTTQRMVSLKIEVKCKRELFIIIFIYLYALPGHEVVHQQDFLICYLFRLISFFSSNMVFFSTFYHTEYQFDELLHLFFPHRNLTHSPTCYFHEVFYRHKQPAYKY